MGSSPQCSVQEDPGQLYSYFGVREEFNADTFSRGEQCQVYLARPGIPVNMVNLTLLVVAEVTPGLPTTCDVQVSVKVSMRISFCTKGEVCKLPSPSVIAQQDPGNATNAKDFSDKIGGEKVLVESVDDAVGEEGKGEEKSNDEENVDEQEEEVNGEEVIGEKEE